MLVGVLKQLQVILPGTTTRATGGGSSGGYYPDAGIYINPEGAGQSVIPGFEPPKGTPYYGGIKSSNC